MLIRICLIIAVVAGLAVSGLNFLKVKEKITTIQGERESERTQKEAAQTELASTKKDLSETRAELKTTKETLATTTEERDRAVAEATSQTRRADKLTDDLNKTRRERDDAQAELAAYKLTELNPQQILQIKNSYKGLQDEIAATQAENKLLGKKIVQLNVELDRYRNPEKPVFLPASLKGKVLVADPKWNFVVLDIGGEQGVLEYGELLVNRNGRLVAKVVVRSVQKDRSIANVLPGWELSEVMEGDMVIPAHPAS
jgi:hypothetical protein